MFRGLSPWMRFLPGGLLHTNIAGCTIFAAVSGSSAATLNMVGKMSIPELRSRGYPEYMIIGTLAGAATLGLMIPPSLTLIVYGVTINESITKLFMAGVFPGLVLAGLFMAYIVVWHFFGTGDRPQKEPSMPFSKMIKESLFLVPVMGLVCVVIGSMYLGFATATEAAAVGVVGALILSAAQGSLNWSTFSVSLMGATKTSAMIALILMGAAFLSLSMGFTGLPRAMAELIESYNLSPVALIAVLTVFYLILGMFMDGLSSVVLTMAIVEPMPGVPGRSAISKIMIICLVMTLRKLLKKIVLHGISVENTSSSEVVFDHVAPHSEGHCPVIAKSESNHSGTWSNPCVLSFKTSDKKFVLTAYRAKYVAVQADTSIANASSQNFKKPFILRNIETRIWEPCVKANAKAKKDVHAIA